jgi:choline dehydrogenase-like flavoprotein
MITETTIQRIAFASESGSIQATGVEAVRNGQLITIRAKKEVILAAGALQTPKVLELSGIGNIDRLARLEIPLVLDHWGVGENLQNHVMSLIPVPLKLHPSIAGIHLVVKVWHLRVSTRQNRNRCSLSLAMRISLLIRPSSPS